MQTRLHRWAAADAGRRFDDLFNFVHDPATLIMAFDRVAGNRGSNTPGVDGLTVVGVEELIGVPGFLDDLRTALRDGSFRPLPVRERKIPKPGGSGKVRRLGIPTLADRVVQAALKLVLEPIFETGFEPVSYGFRPRRRPHDAIAEIHHFGTRGYRWVLDADIEAAFDNLSHSFVMDRVRARVKDKRALALVKAFLKAGVLTELGEQRNTHTGTPQGGILSPLIFNIALSALDEHVMTSWMDGGAMSTPGKRTYRRSRGRPTWRITRYADDFVILVHGSREDTEALREDLARVLATMGLRLSPAKTQVVHMSDGFSFLGFRIRWKRKRGTNKWYVYTFIDARPVRTLKAKIRALTHKTSQWDLASTLTRLGQIMRGWANYFKHAVAKRTFSKLDDFTFWRLAHLLRARHGWSWGQLRRHLTAATGRWQIAADGVEFFRIEKVAVSRYTYRGNKIPTPWPATA
ncbi:group II intron reverse transcriptase/maturase [Streptomyces sp. DSM 41524]|uniref:Group II intron reverse transcriptase/maturase n=1 Tax=Streptomyces asiaticus subsp. ignotus TaxID=3098222 RepID=A0ABU7Q9K1_9ACTN|nr:group II intron reverse transcriptase/maturase [Streptomyces sp. DSM 41524]